jgi:3'-5' exoribonuclease
MYTKDNILTLTEIKKASDGDRLTGLIYVKDYSKKPTKNGDHYLDGICEVVGAMPFKVWSNSTVYASMDSADYRHEICLIEAKVNIYNGMTSLVLEKLHALDLTGSNISSTDFFEKKYDTNRIFAGLHSMLTKSCANPNSVAVFDLIMNDSEVKDRFLLEFAAKNHHDNCVSGLLAHTNKVVAVARVVSMYKNIVALHGNLDALIIGAALHDIGKIYEYDNGVISEKGNYLSHNTMGVLLIAKYKDDIIKLTDEDFYLRLLSIIQQHHGEWGDRPRTIESEIIHLVDKFESSLTDIDQLLEKGEGGSQIYYEGNFLC